MAVSQLGKRIDSFLTPIDWRTEVSPLDGFSLPVRQDPVEISQGFFGPWSHKAFRFTCVYENQTVEGLVDFSYAVDFQVPFGTPVYAAKDGKVWSVVDSDDFYDGMDVKEGMGVRTGQLSILHDDHLSLYSHIGEFVVERDGYVKKGDCIGFSKQTGWIGGVPHVHFAVLKENKSVDYPYRPIKVSHPFIFDDYDGPLEHSEIYK